MDHARYTWKGDGGAAQPPPLDVYVKYLAWSICGLYCMLYMAYVQLPDVFRWVSLFVPFSFVFIADVSGCPQVSVFVFCAVLSVPVCLVFVSCCCWSLCLSLSVSFCILGFDGWLHVFFIMFCCFSVCPYVHVFCVFCNLMSVSICICFVCCVVCWCLCLSLSVGYN